jgi:hypothetical protein
MSPWWYCRPLIFFLYLQPLLWCYIHDSLEIAKWYDLRPKEPESWAKKIIVMIVFNNTKIPNLDIQVISKMRILLS